jgi:hypothetical protein
VTGCRYPVLPDSAVGDAPAPAAAAAAAAVGVGGMQSVTPYLAALGCQSAQVAACAAACFVLALVTPEASGSAN